jgi:PPOX class probable F420-dependent enzyme
MSAEADRLGSEKYVVLTTFRRNGNPVGTPIWLAQSGDELAVWTERNSGKVKRIRATGKVTVQACDVRGRKTHGAVVSGVGRIADDAETEQIRELIKKKYGLLGRLTMFGSSLRGGRDRTVGVFIKLD